MRGSWRRDQGPIPPADATGELVVGRHGVGGKAGCSNIEGWAGSHDMWIAPVCAACTNDPRNCVGLISTTSEAHHALSPLDD